jgi:hypothetical protein
MELFVIPLHHSRRPRTKILFSSIRFELVNALFTRLPGFYIISSYRFASHTAGAVSDKDIM